MRELQSAERHRLIVCMLDWQQCDRARVFVYMLAVTGSEGLAEIAGWKRGLAWQQGGCVGFTGSRCYKHVVPIHKYFEDAKYKRTLMVILFIYAKFNRREIKAGYSNRNMNG